MSARAEKRPPRFRLTSPRVPEHPRQKAIAHALALEIAPAGKVSNAGVCWFAIDHAAAFGEIPATFLARGVIAGIPDLLVLHRGRAHWIETKADDGELEGWQRSVAVAVLVAGCPFAIVRDVPEVLLALDRWCIPRHGRLTLQ